MSYKYWVVYSPNSSEPFWKQSWHFLLWLKISRSNWLRLPRGKTQGQELLSHSSRLGTNGKPCESDWWAFAPREQHKPASQLLSACFKALAFQQGITVLPSSPPRELRLNASSILHALWSYLLIGQCSIMEALHKGECLGSKYEKIQGLGQKSRHILHTMWKSQEMGKEGSRERCV